MERQFALPIGIAAVLHAGLLFGFHARHHDDGAGAGVKVSPASVLTQVVFDYPPPEPVDAPAEPAKGRSDPEPTPAAPEPPTRDADAPFVITVPAVAPLRPDREVMQIGVGFFGPSDGRDGVARLGDRVRIEDIGNLDAVPRTRFQASPQFPPEARQRGTSGEVLVEFIVDETGAVNAPRVVRSSDRLFEEATLRAVAKWRFEPGRRHGRVVSFRMAVPVVFKLNEN